MTAVSFEVLGLPVQQGSHRAVGRGKHSVIIETAKGHAAWRTDVANEARDTMRRAGLRSPLDGPLILTVTFRFPCPTSRTKAHREAAGTDRGAPKTAQPDLDKLVRCIGDALTASGLMVDEWGDGSGAVTMCGPGGRSVGDTVGYQDMPGRACKRCISRLAAHIGWERDILDTIRAAPAEVAS